MVLAFKDPPRELRRQWACMAKIVSLQKRTASSWSVRRRVSDSNNFINENSSGKRAKQWGSKAAESSWIWRNPEVWLKQIQLPRLCRSHVTSLPSVHSLSWVPYGSASQTSVCTQILCLLKMQVLPQEVWSGTQGSAFLTSSQVMLVQLVPGPHSSSQGFVIQEPRTLKLKNW